MPPFAAKLADSLYFFTGSTQETAFFLAAAFAAFAALAAWAAFLASAAFFAWAALAWAAAWAWTACATPDVVVSAAAVATPPPRATEAPKPAARTAARVRMRAGRKERDETRWDIETSRGGDRGEPPGAQDRAVVAVPW